MTSEVAQRVRDAGVVGAGGAGFPTHVKLDAKVDTYIANAAECEPLLCKDQELMRRYADRMVEGLRFAMQSTGAERGVIAIKRKYEQAISALNLHLGIDLELYFYDSFYPAGDEFIIVYDVTGRLIPPLGIPLQVGCAVNNVETLINIAQAMAGQPVTQTALTVAGMVRQPLSAIVPLGVRVREVLELAGGALCDDPVLLDGGAMMGRPLEDLDRPVTKTTGGFIVLPRTHPLIRRKLAPEEVKVHISRAACDQCSYCTELCPRYLLGYAIEPHKVMRSVGFQGDQQLQWAKLGLQCCECGVCDLYACPEDLPPKDMCVRSKRLWQQTGERPEPLAGRGQVHPLRDSRRVPLSRLIRRLGLTPWDVPAPLTDRTLDPAEVQLKLLQHIGAPAQPVVREGEHVRRGQLIATIPEGKLGANLHGSIDGRVSRIDQESIWLRR